MRVSWWLGVVFAGALVVGCGDDGGHAVDAARVDAGAAAEAGPMDAGAADASFDAAAAPDATVADAGVDASVFDAGTDAGPGPIGVLAGSCGELDDTELLGDAPFFFRGSIDFPDGYTSADEARLSDGAREILADGTSGGSSELSEAFAFEVLARCEGAVLIKSETEIDYDPADSKKTDMLVEIDGHRIGVSVTRAVGFPRDDPYTVTQARTLLEDKLADILESSANVVSADGWVKQILHVIAYEPMHGDSMMSAWGAVDDALRADTILWVTVSDGMDEFLY